MARRELSFAQLAVARAVERALAGIDGDVVVGVSGGADSLALAAGAAWAAGRPSATATPRAIVVDHRLQAGSADVAERAAEQCRGLRLPAEVVAVDVEPGGNVEARARDARLAALSASGVPVLLGHTLDDQAESVLLGLARGSGTRSLAGMAPRRGPFLRPLLALRRDDVARACADWGLEPWSDPHNADPSFARVRVRELALPVLEDTIGPGVAEALARTARLARADADFLDALASRYDVGDELAVSDVEGLPDALRTRVLRRWLVGHGSPGHADHVEAVDRLLTAWRGQGPIDAGAGVRVERADGVLCAAL